MIRVITDKQKIAKLHAVFTRTLRKNFTEHFNCRIGFPGGSWNGNIQYSPTLDLWISQHQLPNRFWNGFGHGEPIDWNSNSISGEINFPFEGINRRIAGVFAVEDNGNILVLHRGRIGGGKPGIGKNFFTDNFRGDFITAYEGNRETQFCLVGELSSSLFVNQVSTFIFEIRRIKNLEDVLPIFENLNKFQFTQEHSGTTVSERSRFTTINRTHGIITNSLANNLESRGHAVGNDKYRDLFIHEKGHITTLFEIKTNSSTQCLYEAVGQLIIYSIPMKNTVKLRIVVPDKLSKPVESKLKQLRIVPIYYQWKNGEPEFINLDADL